MNEKQNVENTIHYWGSVDVALIISLYDIAKRITWVTRDVIFCYRSEISLVIVEVHSFFLIGKVIAEFLIVDHVFYLMHSCRSEVYCSKYFIPLLMFLWVTPGLWVILRYIEAWSQCTFAFGLTWTNHIIYFFFTCEQSLMAKIPIPEPCTWNKFIFLCWF